MLPNEVKPYSESYQHLWRNHKDYQEFRFNLMNMMVDDAYDKVCSSFDSSRKASLKATVEMPKKRLEHNKA